MTRCESRWQQMPSEPVIQCARATGHTGMHFNTAMQRQWDPECEQPFRGRLDHPFTPGCCQWIARVHPR